MNNQKYHRAPACALRRLAFVGLMGFASLGALAQTAGMTLVATNDCGVPGQQPFLISGENYTMPVQGSPKAVTCNFGGKVIYAFNGLDKKADYRLEVVYLADMKRIQHIVVDGNELQEPVELEPGKEQRYMIDLPRKAYAYGELVLVFECAGTGPNAIVSELNLYSTNAKKPQPFPAERRYELSQTRTYKLDRDVDVEAVLPTYAPRPASVAGVARPVVSLNGEWQFNPRPAADFFKTTAASDGWSKIQVPGEWAMQGFKVDSAAFGGYRRTFTVPQDWKGQRVRLRFDGVSSEYHVYVNGQEAGYHMGGMTPYELDITRFVRPGQNTLALSVRSESLADMLGSLTQYAAHQIGGITRKVTLFAVPQVHLSDVRIETPWEADYRDARLRLKLRVDNASARAMRGVSLRCTIEELGKQFAQKLGPVPAGKHVWQTVSEPVKAPKPWTSETPNRYTLKVEVLSGGRVVETVRKKFGFRDVKVRGNELFVNGRPIKLHGVCRHEVNPTGGRVVPAELEVLDVTLYRAGNCNFIRTSHYPPTEEMLDACDSLGMFVEAESPVCWVGHGTNENWQKLNYRDEKYFPYILQANMENIQFNRNHPSVLIWSMANESYWCKTFAQTEVYVLAADSTRPHTFHDQAYGGFNNQGSTAPIANIHYPGPGGYLVAAKSERPMIYGEYCHLNVYNRSELVTDPGVRNDWGMWALRPTWENIYKTRGALGGSIWSGIDDIFHMPDGRAVGYGPWGPIDEWRRPKPEYWDMKKIYTPIKLFTTTLPAQARPVIELQNRYFFLNLSALNVKWQCGSDQGTLSLDCAPGDTARISIPLTSPRNGAQLRLTFTDPRGFVADEFLIPVGERRVAGEAAPARTQTSLERRGEEWEIGGGDMACTVSATTGQITNLKRGGQTVLTGGPVLMALPLTGGGCYPDHNTRTPVFNATCTDWHATSVKAERRDNNVVVTVEGRYKEFEGGYTLTINGNGELTVDYAFRALEDVNPRQCGLTFSTPRSMDETFWHRRALWSIYPDDHIGRPEGSAPLFYADAPQGGTAANARPAASWSHDAGELGSADFRSSRRNIYAAGLRQKGGAHKVTALSDGTQTFRCWLDGNGMRFLVADFAAPGDEMFLGGYYGAHYRPIKKGQTISGCTHLLAQ